MKTQEEELIDAVNDGFNESMLRALKEKNPGCILITVGGIIAILSFFAYVICIYA
jgi:hypothetical protein